VEQSAESVAAPDVVDLGCCVVGEWSQGSGLAESAVRPVTVVVELVLAKYGRGMGLVDDQDVVEEFAADGADEAFGDGVARGACTGVRTIWMPLEVKTASTWIFHGYGRGGLRLTGPRF
jgi:hypothetical protein